MTPRADTLYWYDILPRLGTAAEFDAVRQFLRDCDFTYEPVCRRLGVEHLHLLTAPAEQKYLQADIADRLDVLIRLLLIGRFVDDPTAGRYLGREGIDCLERLSLLKFREENQAWFAPVMVHPVPGGTMVCDRNSSPDGVPLKQPPADAIYPALFENTLDFVARFPRTPCDNILEIGTGTATAAIAWSGVAREIWATDIAARAVHFAEFNRRLAGVENIHVAEGDLYSPVEGMTFDRIACHPPFVPARRSAVIFRDGGGDGEEIARRIIEGVPRFLRPNGIFWASFMISDRAGELAEQRIRSWLGENENEFDVGLAMESRRTPAETIARVVLNSVGSSDLPSYLAELWKANGTEFLLHACVMIRRHTGTRAAVTARSQIGKDFRGEHLEWFLDWTAAKTQPGFVEALLESRPSLAPRGSFHGTHRVEAGAVVSEEFTFEPDTPLRASCRCPAWMMQMLLRCDGARTVRDHFAMLQAEGTVPEGGSAVEFAGIIAGLGSAGALQVSLPGFVPSWPEAALQAR